LKLFYACNVLCSNQYFAIVNFFPINQQH